MVAHACNPGAWDADAEESRVWAQPELGRGTEDTITQLLQPSPSLVTLQHPFPQDISSISEVYVPCTNALKSTTASGVLVYPLPDRSKGVLLYVHLWLLTLSKIKIKYIFCENFPYYLPPWIYHLLAKLVLRTLASPICEIYSCMQRGFLPPPWYK